METDVRLVRRIASDALAGRGGDRRGADRRGRCLEEVPDFRRLAWADVLELRFALALRPQGELLTAHLGLAFRQERRPPAVATRGLPRDAKLALQDESELVEREPQSMALPARVSLPARLAWLLAQRSQAAARQRELRWPPAELERHQLRESPEAWLREWEPRPQVWLPEQEPQVWVARPRVEPQAAFLPLLRPRLWRLFPLWP